MQSTSIRTRSIRNALAEWRFFDLVHKKLYVKVDCYVRPDEGIHGEEMRRAQRTQLGDSPADSIFLATAEDTVIQKLLWFRMGDEISDRQWRDVLGLLKTRRGRLDEDYLDRWSIELGIDDLLRRARVETASRRS